MSQTTKEKKVAQKFIDLVNDFSLDIEMVGIYIASMTSSVLYNRLYEVFDSARHHKEEIYTANLNPELKREQHYRKMEELGRK